jgi:hypothetical protein
MINARLGSDDIKMKPHEEEELAATCTPAGQFIGGLRIYGS